MKKKILLPSIATIIVCLCLIAGSTFALFTSTSNVNISVTAGDVEMVAGIAITKLESVKGDVNGTIVDENGNTYSYEEVSPNFTNGGTAEVVGSVLTLDKVTPGDKVTFEISGKNTSNVAIQYRYVIECLNGENLMKGLNFTVNGVAIDKYMESYTSPWAPLAVGSDITNVPITIELPVTAGNEFQNESTEIRVLVEAVQGNAVVDANTDPVITYFTDVASKEDFDKVLADPYLPGVTLTADIGKVEVNNVSNKTVDAQGHDVALVFKGTVENFAVKNVVNKSDAGIKIDVSGANGNILVENCEFISGSGTSGQAIKTGANMDVTVKACTFTSAAGYSKTYAFYGFGAKNVEISDCDFVGFASWAYMINGSQYGDLVVNGCTFTSCKAGLVKSGVKGGAGTTGTVGGDFVFTNNTVVDSAAHSGAWFGVTYEGNAVVTGNTIDGAEWIPGADQGIVQK